MAPERSASFELSAATRLYICSCLAEAQVGKERNRATIVPFLNSGQTNAGHSVG